MRKFTYDIFDTISQPTLILSTKYHKHLGNLVNVQNISNEFNMASHQEISFDVYKEVDGTKCTLWDQLVDFKYLYVPEHNEYYELQVDIDETNSIVKHCVGVSASECELSQKYLRDFHCNDETDILRDDYVVTVLYNPLNSEGSLLDRVLHDKGQSWSIAHVDSSIASIQRTFTADNTTLYDFLTNTVAKEIGCLFLFNSVDRSISVYDLYNKCNNCGLRADFVDYCPKCKSTNFKQGYGTYQNVFVASENFATQITVDGDADSVKNCFKVSGGDDLITATVANLNPNKSNYIYRFSDDMLNDMPVELKNKLANYDTLYSSLLPTYNTYTEAYYNAVDKELEYQTTMMPETPIPGDTTAEEQLNILTNTNFIVTVQDVKIVGKSSADLAVKGYAKVLIDPRYTVEVSDSELGDLVGEVRTWKGKFTVKSLGGLNEDGEEDTATSDSKKSVTINGGKDHYEQFLKQKIDKSLDRTDAAFITIFDIENDDDFKAELKKYSLDRLNSFSNTYQSVLEILIKQGVASVDDPMASDYKIELYEPMYLPYYRRKGYIDAECVVRQGQVDTQHALVESYNQKRAQIQAQLNLQKYLGNTLYQIFTLYLREDTYSNSNYISDGLDNKEVIDKAKELMDVAEAELYKASELQYSLTGTLQNFLNTEEFKSIKSKFEIGDWIVCKADNKLYRLRLINVGYSYDSPTDIQVTFSNATRINNSVNDFADVLNKAGSMATSYDYFAHQASQGNKAQDTVKGFLKTGLDSTLINVLSGENQEVTLDEHGITIKEYIDTIDDYSPEQLKVTSSILAFTKDNWKTASLGLGKHNYMKYDEAHDAWVVDEDYGLSATFVQAGYVSGSTIYGGQIYSTNYKSSDDKGTHIDLENGSFSFAGGNFTYDGNNSLMLGGFNVVTDGIMNNYIEISANGEIISDYLVGKVDSTTGAQHHGEIFNTYADGALPWAEHENVDMLHITKFTYGNTDTKVVSEIETKITWVDDITDKDEHTLYYGNVFYYTEPIDITNWKYLGYQVATTTRNDRDDGDMYIGFTSTPPTGYQDTVTWDAKLDISSANTFYRGTINISNLSGEKYLVVVANHGWNASIKKLQFTNYYGTVNKAVGVQSRASGNGTTASGRYSSASGNGTTATGESSSAEGTDTIVTSKSGHVEGYQTQVHTDYAHAEGFNTMVAGSGSYGGHAEGYNTMVNSVSSAMGAHAEGYYAWAFGQGSHAEGGRDTNNSRGAFGYYSHTEGWDCHVTAGETYGGHAEGYYTTITGGYGGHAEGYKTEVNNGSDEGGHAEGYQTSVEGGYGAHAEGRNTHVYSASGGHAEGYSTMVYGSGGDSFGAHAEGYETEVGKYENGAYRGADAAHAEGYKTKAQGYYSHASGHGTIANSLSQFVFGEYNIEDPTIYGVVSRGTYVEIVGNGSSISRSNARTLDWNGNEWLAGKLTVGTNPTNPMDVATKQYVDNITGVSDFTGATASSNGVHGLVPAPLIADREKFLKGDGTWTTIASATDFTGATSTTAGTHGLVSAPSAGDQNKYLKGDGTWSTLPAFSGSSSGLVPTSASTDQSKYLKGDGSWATIDMPSVFTGATASTAGTVGTVPAPSAGYNTRFLSGNGAWERITNLENYYTSSTRPTTANQTMYNGLYYFLATGKMTEGKPPSDSHIIHTGWDSDSAGGAAQLAISHGTNPLLWVRCQTGGVNGTWTGWYRIPVASGSGVITANRAVVTNGSSRLTASAVTSTELSYLSGVTSSVQTQLDDKSTVSFTRTLSSGTKIGSITIDGTVTDIYAPTGGSGGGGIADVLVNGTSVVSDNIAEIDLTSYAKSSTLSTVATSGSYNDLSNTPTLGTASMKNVASSGNASNSQVVMGNDTRLTDSRPASDVSAWAKASTKPTYTASEVGAQETITGAATTITSSNLTANRVLVSNSSGKVATSSITATELGYLDNVTSDIQTQLNSKGTVHSLTQAEYDALTEAQKKNGELYFITDNDVISYRELTQAQYNALSYAEKHNSTLYFITDAS